MEPWYRVVTLRKEVREGRSFSPDEFAIALEQVVDGTAPEDYSDPNAVLLPHVLHTGADGSYRDGAPAPDGRNRQHVPSGHLGDPIRRRQDPHAHHAVSPGKSRQREASRLPGVRRASEKQPGFPRHPQRGSASSSATPGTPAMARKPHGSRWPASSRVKTESPHSAQQREPHRPGRMRSPACSRRPMHPCWCSSTKSSIS